KTIACIKGGTFQQLMLEALVKNNMTIKDVNYIPMSSTQTYKAILAGKVDAAVLNTSQMLDAKKRGARVLTTARGLMRPKLVVAVNESFAHDHPDWVGRYVKVQNQAMAFIKNHKREALQLAVQERAISYKEAEWLYNNTKLINTLNKDDVNSLKDDIDFLFYQKLIPRKVDILSQGAAIDILFEDFVRDQISICAVSSRSILDAFHSSSDNRLRHN
ncbi:MAG: ABC transporter substrate-binding protein, partial [Desulfobacteraceae bacterium]|nr:ABC transporter substrate-binding protein [Desulfobacteraceae bacterium]